MSWVQYFHMSLEVWGGLFCAVAGFAILLGTNNEKDHMVVRMELTTALLLWMDAVAWGFRGYPGTSGYIGVRVSNFLVFTISFIIAIQFTTYAVVLLGDKAEFPVHTWLWAEIMINFAGIVIIVVNVFSRHLYYFDSQNIYHRAESYSMIMIVGLVGTVLNIVFMFLNYHGFEPKIFWALMSYLLLPFVAGVIQIFFYGIGILNMAIAVSMLAIFFVWQINRTRQQLLLRAELIEKENEILDMQQDMMLSQIKPHFLYNSLTAIAQLCEKDPKQAKKATIAFADYMRGNMDALSTREPVPFEKELTHIENYMKLEQIRFGDELEVIYDIETVGFRVPVLSIQPIVENAVKHGIKRKGTVLIHTQEFKDGYEIRIEDDGVGFDFERLKEASDDPERSHIGIDNVRKRLRTMCHGSLTYMGNSENGTTAIVWIPKDNG